MLDTFKARLKAKIKALGLNLSTKRMDAYADRLHKKHPDITEEADHDKFIDELNEDVNFQEIAKLEDQVRTAESKLKNAPVVILPKKEDQDDDPDDDEPQQPVRKKRNSELIDLVKSLVEKVDSITQKEKKQTIKEKLKGSLQGIPESYYDEWQLPNADEEIEAFETKVKAKWEAFNKENPVITTPGHKPQRSNGAPDNKPTDAELDAILDKTGWKP